MAQTQPRSAVDQDSVPVLSHEEVRDSYTTLRRLDQERPVLQLSRMLPSFAPMSPMQVSSISVHKDSVCALAHESIGGVWLSFDEPEKAMMGSTPMTLGTSANKAARVSDAIMPPQRSPARR